MSGEVRRIICRCALVAIALVAAAHAGSVPRAAGGSLDPFWQPTSVTFPAGLGAIAEGLSGGLVAAVTADIDDDGDLDVVATDSALNLLVWVNDGNGHLTRQRPRHSGGVSTSASGPTLERRPVSLPVTTLNDPPAAGLGARLLLDAGLPGAPRPPTFDPFVQAPASAHRPSRAPPLAA